VNVCLVNLDFVPYRSSGLAVYGETLVQGLAGRRNEVTMLAAQRPGLPSYEQMGRIIVRRVPVGPSDWIGYAWRVGPLVAKLNRSAPFDIVHFLDAHFAYHCRGHYVASLFQSFRQRATSNRGLPYHSNWRNLATRLLYYHAARWLAEKPAVQRADHLLASSRATANEFIAHYGVRPERVTVVPLGIDLDRFQPCDGKDLRAKLGLSDKPVLLYVGFSTPRKGLDYLAQAFSLLSEHVRLLIIGRWEKGYRARFYELLGSSGADRVIEVGYVPDDELPGYYTLADLFVLPTLLEGFGLPIAEALACGTPVVTTEAGSAPEVTGPGGRIVPARDPLALAQAIDELLQDADLRSQLSQRGRDWVLAHFGKERMVDDTLSVYRSIVAPGPS
jgi:glycosyltransferase involved in cell wall biosynthesis